MRPVDIGAPRYPVRVSKVPLVPWVAAGQFIQFTKPNDALFHTIFQDMGVVHIYMSLKSGRRAAEVTHQMDTPMAVGFHLQSENVLYSTGPLRYIPGISGFLC